METTQTKVIQWANERGLLKPENKWKQLAKLQEECGELAAAMLKGKEGDFIDAVGDIQVVLIILVAQYLGNSFGEKLGAEYCLEQAYNQIKDRKGKTVDGTFIKD